MNLRIVGGAAILAMAACGVESSSQAQTIVYYYPAVPISAPAASSNSQPIEDGCGSRNSWLTPEVARFLPFNRQFCPSCNGHDRCYATPGANRLQCDLEFRRRMGQTCDQLPWPYRGACHVSKEFYFLGARIGAGRAFRISQQEAYAAQARSQQVQVYAGGY